jgi:hypothetical protein
VEIGFWFLDLRCDGDVDWVFSWRRRMVEYGDEEDGGERIALEIERQLGE